jgi:hypothetical protein
MISFVAGMFNERHQNVFLQYGSGVLTPEVLFNPHYSYQGKKALVIRSIVGDSIESTAMFAALTTAETLFHSTVSATPESELQIIRKFPDIEQISQQEFDETLLEISFRADQLEELLFEEDIN